MGKLLDIQSHYENHTASSFESAYFYSHGDYVRHVRNVVQSGLVLPEKSDRLLLDVGGGTGNFTRMLVDDCDKLRAVVVEPFLEKSPECDDDKLQFVKASAESFTTDSNNKGCWWRKSYHQVLLKEVIHHIDPDARARLYESIRCDLSKASAKENSEYPQILIVTRPQAAIDYPFWPEAKKVWMENRPSIDELKQELSDAGYHVSHKIEKYDCKVALKQWQQMVKDRFWSMMSHFTDDELEEGCRRLMTDEKSRIDEDGYIHFEDRLVLISAHL